MQLQELLVWWDDITSSILLSLSHIYILLSLHHICCTCLHPQPCSVGSFAVKQASTTCQTCPAGYNCSIASSIPIAIDNSCPTTPTCQTGLPTSRPTVADAHSSGSTNPLLIVVGSIGCVILVVCIVSTGLLTCFCLRAKKRKGERERQRERGWGEEGGWGGEWREGWYLCVMPTYLCTTFFRQEDQTGERATRVSTARQVSQKNKSPSTIISSQQN